MEEKVCREAAEAEVKSWEALFGVSLDEAARERFIPLVQYGRVLFDEAAETFTYSLRKPVDLENGDRLEKLTLREPTTREMQDASKNSPDDVTRAIRLVSYVSGQPLGVLHRVGLRDITNAGLLMGFFA